MDVTRTGTMVGEDKFGNKYFEDNSYFMPRNRWVVYPDRVWLDYDATQVPPEWSVLYTLFDICLTFHSVSRSSMMRVVFRVITY